MSRSPQTMNVIKLFQTGQQYRLICPKDKSLASSFPEVKIIFYLELAIKFIPPFIVALFVWQYYMHTSMIITLLTAIFAISLPIQGIFWLGKRAQSPLPLTLITFYNNTKQKLIENQLIAAKSTQFTTLNFMNFMKLFTLARLHFGDDLDNQNNNV